MAVAQDISLFSDLILAVMFWNYGILQIIWPVAASTIFYAYQSNRSVGVFDTAFHFKRRVEDGRSHACQQTKQT